MPNHARRGREFTDDVLTMGERRSRLNNPYTYAIILTEQQECNRCFTVQTGYASRTSFGPVPLL